MTNSRINRESYRWLALEGTAIVASILLAFAIDAWWDTRQNRAKADDLLEALRSEWVAEIEKIDRHLLAYDGSMSAMIEILNAHSSDEIQLSAADAIEKLQIARRVSTYKPATAAYEVVLDFGLDQIEDSELRLAIASWRSVLDEIEPEQEALHQLFLMDSRIRRARISHELKQSWSRDGDSESFEWFGADPAEMALATIRDDERIIILRHQLNLFDGYVRQLRGVAGTLNQNLEILASQRSE
jgi:hypothetical protein